jgi:starch synthase
MYSLRYGTVPVVRATGGLDDSIRQFDPSTGTGNGFKFEEASPNALVVAVKKALAAFGQPHDWQALVRNAFNGDFSWEKSAGEYMNLYRKLAEL